MGISLGCRSEQNFPLHWTIAPVQYIVIEVKQFCVVTICMSFIYTVSNQEDNKLIKIKRGDKHNCA